MKTVTLEVASEADVRLRTRDAFAGKSGQARISFATPELLWKVLTAKRWDLLKALAGREPISLRATARLVNRDVKSVHSDVHVLLNAGVLDRNEDGRIVFPFDAVRVNFTLHAA
jgi:predicted transcriptional regulator